MKHIKIRSGIGKYTNGREYVNISEDLDFEIEYSFKPQAEVYYVANNGHTKMKGLIKDNKFTIPFEFLRLGKLMLKIEEVSNGNINEFAIEDLVIQEIEDKIESIPEVDKLKAEIEIYSNLVKKLERQNEILTKLVGGLYNTEIKVDVDK